MLSSKTIKNISKNISKISSGLFSNVKSNIGKLNSSKYFVGIVLLVMNIGSRYVTIKLSKTHEQLVKNLITKDLLIFSILFISLRDVLLALAFTAIFKILSDYVFNENSRFCMVPKQYKKIYDAVDENKDGKISEKEIENALALLNKSQKQRALEEQKNALLLFNNNNL